MGEITKRIYYSQFNCTESMLQDYARKGLILKDYEMSRWTFEEGEPIDRRYRITPVIPFGRKREIAKWEAAGWIHFPTGLGGQMFYTDDESLPEVYPDKKSFRNRFMFSGLSNLFWTIVLAVLLTLIARRDVSEFFNTEYFTTGETIFLLVIAIPLFAFWLYGLWDGIVNAYVFFNNKPIDHNVPYERRERIGNCLFYGLLGTLALCVIGGIVLCFGW